MCTITDLGEVRQIHQEAATQEVRAILSQALTDAFNAAFCAAVKQRWPAELRPTVDLFFASVRAELEELEQLEQKRRGAQSMSDVTSGPRFLGQPFGETFDRSLIMRLSKT